MTLKGLFFVHDNGEYYRTGTVDRQVHPDAYLVRYDVMNLSSDMPTEGMELVTVSGAMSSIGADGFPAFRFFETRDQLEAWLEWLDSPRKAAVVSLVRKDRKP